MKFFLMSSFQARTEPGISAIAFGFLGFGAFTGRPREAWQFWHGGRTRGSLMKSMKSWLFHWDPYSGLL